VGLFWALRSVDPRPGAWLALAAGLAVTLAWTRAGRSRREGTLRRFVEGIEEGYFFYRHDRSRRYDYLSPSVSRVLGYEPEEFRAASADLFTDHPINVDGRQRTARTVAGEAQAGFEVEVRAKDGTARRLEVTEYPVFGSRGEVRFVEGIAHDVTEVRSLQARLEELATRDELSGLFNRRHFRERLEEAAGLARRHGHPMSLAIVDLDGLKAVNDTYGHAAGDTMIRGAAAVLSAELRRGDVVGRLDAVPGRLGGDEFGAILPYSASDGATIALQRVLAAFAATLVPVGPGVSVPIAASAGIAELAAKTDLVTLETQADGALYQAKRRGRGRIEVWTPDEEPT
jgi:diguanylate cyclase (GGDEF)-like protein/PAS domain S-box-containing protein